LATSSAGSFAVIPLFCPRAMGCVAAAATIPAGDAAPLPQPQQCGAAPIAAAAPQSPD